MSTVVQSWLECLPWKMQSILFSGLRGPDTAALPEIKQLSKWLRAISQENADPSKPYMSDSWPTIHTKQLEKELEFCTAHFVHHFADGLRVVAFGHPDSKVKEFAFGLHLYIAEELFHFIPEDDRTFAWRHRDQREGRDRQLPPRDRDWACAMAGRRPEDPHP